MSTQIELSERELKIAALVARGKNNWMVAHDLDLTEAQVKNSLREIYEKLKMAAKNQPIPYDRRQRIRAELANWWWEHHGS